MTVLISVIGIVGRMAGDVLASSLGWASSLLFGRVPRSHQVLVALMLAGSLLWILLIAAALVPDLGIFLRKSTPVVSGIDVALIRVVVLATIALLPIGIGLAAYLAPSRDERAQGVAAIGQVLRGYPLAVAMGTMLLFLPAVGIDRKVRSLRKGWSDGHVPIVVKPGRYDQLVRDLRDALEKADLAVDARDAPGILTVPGRALALIANGSIGGLVPDRLIELHRRGLEVGVYPSDVAVSGGTRQRTHARAVIVSGLATTAAYFTTSAESQAIEDRIAELIRGGRFADRDLQEIDDMLLELDVAPEDWDTLYRLRLQAERDALRD
jgi:hypothetical protein